jgi:hypothetical protein
MLKIVPIFQKTAKDFIRNFHRHHPPPVGSIFQVACANDGKIVGVCMVGRPVARRLQDGFTVEVIRLCTDGTKNVCSKLYSAAAHIARLMGYRRIITYILESEKGISLRASGWLEAGRAGGISWNVPSRPRLNKCPAQMKIRFEKNL